MKNVITRSICCDVVISLTDQANFQRLLNKAAENPQWLRHSFIVVLDKISEEVEKKLQEWYYDTRVKHPMPDVTFIRARGDIEGRITMQYKSALVAGDNPFVYFQDEKDNLPINIDKSIYHLYYNKNIDVVIGKCETFLQDGTPVEVFPMTNIKGEFLYDCHDAMMLFPSYAHPLSSVIRKSLFNKIDYSDDSEDFNEFAFYDFALRAMQDDNVGIEYMPYTIKISTRCKQYAVAMGPLLRQRLVSDAKLWIKNLPVGNNKEFQIDIIKMLECGEITTFKEIDARVEDYMDSHKK